MDPRPKREHAPESVLHQVRPASILWPLNHWGRTMKRLLALTFAVAAFHAPLASAQTCQRFGNQVFCDNGVSSQRLGDTTYYNNGMTRQDLGNQSYYSNGASSQRIGNTEFYSNGTTRQRLGNTDFYSNGRTCQTINNVRYCN